MNLNMDDLYKTLASECFFAADRFNDMVGAQTQEEYDSVFKHVATAVQPIVMWDGVISEAAREVVVRGVVERSYLTNEMHVLVDQQFFEYVRANASEGVLNLLEPLVERRAKGDFSAKNYEHSYRRFDPALFYGAWMEEYALQEVVEKLSTLHYKTRVPFNKNGYSQKERIDIIALQWQGTPEGIIFENFLNTYSTHAKFSQIVDSLGHDRDGYDRFVKFGTLLSDETNKILWDLCYEMERHWNNFNFQRVNILSSQLAQSVQARCADLLRHMEQDAGLEIAIPVQPLDKSNVEEFRQKHKSILAGATEQHAAKIS